jgi:hypothetical protein
MEPLHVNDVLYKDGHTATGGAKIFGTTIRSVQQTRFTHSGDKKGAKGGGSWGEAKRVAEKSKGKDPLGMEFI